MTENKLPKIIVICGPTASGKTEWSLRLAEKYGGEVISADSRQIYKKMNIGTAKEPGEWRWHSLRRTYFVQDIPHHLMDFLDPGKIYTVAEFRDHAIKHIKLALRNNHVPFIVGGTGLYIDAVVNNFRIPQAAPNKKLRESLEIKSVAELSAWLQKMDPEAFAWIDKKNKRRLVRALEVVMLTGEPFSAQRQRGEKLFEVLELGVAMPREVLYNKIDRRVDEQVKNGLLDEIQQLLKQKYSWNLASMSGIGYRQFKDYFAGKTFLEAAVDKLKKDTRDYAKRQLTWFKKNKNIRWVENLAEADKLVAGFLKEK